MLDSWIRDGFSAHICCLSPSSLLGRRIVKTDIISEIKRDARRSISCTCKFFFYPQNFTSLKFFLRQIQKCTALLTFTCKKKKKPRRRTSQNKHVHGWSRISFESPITFSEDKELFFFFLCKMFAFRKLYIIWHFHRNYAPCVFITRDILYIREGMSAEEEYVRRERIKFYGISISSVYTVAHYHTRSSRETFPFMHARVDNRECAVRSIPFYASFNFNASARLILHSRPYNRIVTILRYSGKNLVPQFPGDLIHVICNRGS